MRALNNIRKVAKPKVAIIYAGEIYTSFSASRSCRNESIYEV